MTKFEEELMATAMMIPTSDGNEIKFKTSSALYDYLLLSNGEAELYLQQQALPVVPECVDVAIKSLPDRCSALEAISLIKQKVETLPVENEDWLPVYNWLCEDIENQNAFALAFITGKYQVEKPQLFYLKNKLTGLWLMRDEVDKVYPYDHTFDIRNRDKFTQQEIDSMQTGSYEQIEVTE